MYPKSKIRTTLIDALSSVRNGAIVLLITILALPFAKARAQEGPDSATEFVFHAPSPLGAEAFQLMPGKRNFYLFGSIENHDFDGIHVYRLRHKTTVTRNGVAVSRYPNDVVFRITASTITPEGAMDPPGTIDYSQDVTQLLLGLRFKLLVLRGLEKHVLEPTEVRMIGMPNDQPADERVYRVAFKMHDVPPDARLALQVYTPDGDRITRFRIELF